MRAGRTTIFARPLACRQAGDADNQATEILSVFSMNLPVFCSSNNADTSAGFLLGTGTVYANMCFVNCGGAGTTAPWLIDDTGHTNQFQRRYFNNITNLFQNGPMNRLVQDGFFPAIVEKYTLIASNAVPSGNGALIASSSIKQLVIHPKTQHQSIFRNDDLDTDILMLYNQSNSVANIAHHTTSEVGLSLPSPPVATFAGSLAFVRIAGFINSLGIAAEPLWQIDDYYGDGPLLLGGLRKPRASMLTTINAQHNSNRVMRFEVSSEGPANLNHWGHFHQRPCSSSTSTCPTASRSTSRFRSTWMARTYSPRQGWP
jgi:hypothetical protein